MTLSILEQTDWVKFAKKVGLSDDQIDHINEEVSYKITRHIDKEFYVVVPVDALKVAMKDLWSDDDSHKKYFDWLSELETYQYVMIG